MDTPSLDAPGLPQSKLAKTTEFCFPLKRSQKRKGTPATDLLPPEAASAQARPPRHSSALPRCHWRLRKDGLRPPSNERAAPFQRGARNSSERAPSVTAHRSSTRSAPRGDPTASAPAAPVAHDPPSLPSHTSGALRRFKMAAAAQPRRPAAASPRASPPPIAQAFPSLAGGASHRRAGEGSGGGAGGGRAAGTGARREEPGTCPAGRARRCARSQVCAAPRPPRGQAPWEALRRAERAPGGRGLCRLTSAEPTAPPRGPESDMDRPPQPPAAS